MSWLLVAFIPGLLMLATFGLDRLEASLDRGADPVDDTAELIEYARVESVRRPNAVTDTEPLGTLPHREVPDGGFSAARPSAGLPTRVYVHHRPNPQFQPTRQADRV